MIKIACDLTIVKCTKDARRLLQKFALPATKLRKNVKAPSAGCYDSLLFLKKKSILNLRKHVSFKTCMTIYTCIYTECIRSCDMSRCCRVGFVIRRDEVMFNIKLF